MNLARDMDVSYTSEEVCQANSSLSSSQTGGFVSTRSLSQWLEPRLLRGANLHHCIVGWRTYLAQREPRSLGDLRLSRVTKRIDNFLSHDWQTAGWLKALTLVVLFNSRAAAIATWIVTLVIALFRILDLFPQSTWTVFLAHATFLLFLCFWQKIRSLWRPRMVFLDRLCIAQNDPSLKEKGILGLAAFLDCSRELTILWSPRYFRRLWCIYELATYFRRKNMRKPLQVMPVTLALFIAVNALSWCIMVAWYHLIKESNFESWNYGTYLNTIAGVACVALASIMVPWTYYLGLQLMTDLQEMPEQLKSFRIQDALSSCCANEHLNPETMEEIGCDRQLVFSALSSWFGRDGKADSHLEEFNQMVRDRLAPIILQTVGGDALPLKYTWYMVGICEVPFLSPVLTKIAHPPENMSGYLAVIWAMRLLSEVFFLSLLGIFATRLNLKLCKLGQRWTPYVSKICLSIVLSQVAILAVTIFWTGFASCVRNTAEDNLLPILPVSLLIACLCALFCSQGSPRGAHVAHVEAYGEGAEGHTAAAQLEGSRAGPSARHGLAALGPILELSTHGTANTEDFEAKDEDEESVFEL
ncbi:Uncharacterized protein SCF082_LOCUS30854 [Durusdinium trenchii]|uniref:Uncharacterized protein n=1 Tax=Durusdinium trenchii TaxID=1381693 RepID=A0ABP0N3J4_9DINO